MKTKTTRPASKPARKPAPAAAVTRSTVFTLHLHPHLLQILADGAVFYVVTTPDRVPDEHPGSLHAFAVGFIGQTGAKLVRFDAAGKEIA